MSESAVSHQAATGRDSPKAGTAGEPRHQEAQRKQGAEPGRISWGEKPIQNSYTDPCHQPGLQEPEPGERGVRGCGSYLLTQNQIGITREGNLCCPLLGKGTLAVPSLLA